MTDVTRLLDLKFGLHSSVTDFTSTPATVTTIQPRSIPPVMRPSREFIARELYSVDGRRFPHVRGRQALAAINCNMEMRGVNSNTGAAVADWEAKMEQGRMLAALFGAVATASTGAAPTASGTAGATLTVSTTVIVNGDIILFTTSAGTFIRQVTSGGGTTTLTLDRAASGTASGTVIRLAQYSLATATTGHVHGYFRSEFENSRTDFYGCAAMSGELVIPNSGLVEFNSTWMPTSWADIAEANPTYAAPTAGNPIVSAGSSFYIGATSYMVRNLRLRIDNGMSERTSTTGTNGVVGYVAAAAAVKSAILEGELYVGNNTGSIGEVVDDSGTPALGAITGDADNAGVVAGTYDVALQVGVDAGASMYVRIPAADMTGTVQDGGGLKVLKFSAAATAPSSGSPFYLGVA